MAAKRSARRVCKASYEAATLAVMQQQSLLTIEQVCRALAISRATLWKLREAGLIKPVKLGTVVRFRPADVQRLIGGD